MTQKTTQKLFIVDTIERSTGKVLLSNDEYRCDVPDNILEHLVLVKNHVEFQYRSGFRLLMAYQPRFRERMSEVTGIEAVRFEIHEVT